MEKQNNKEHSALATSVEKIISKLDNLNDKLEEKFVMRKEFKVGLGIIGFIATSLGIIGFFI